MKKRLFNHPHNNSIGDFFIECCDKYQHRKAYHYLGTDITFTELKQKAIRFGYALQQYYSLRPDDRVALMLPNCPQFPISLYGTLLAGGIVVNINPQYTSRELEHQLKDSGAKIIVVLDNVAHVLEECIENTSIQHIIIANLGDCIPTHKAIFLDLHLRFIKRIGPQHKLNDVHQFTQMIQDDADPVWQPYKADWTNIAFLQYTGGTTGKSKGAMLTHKNILYNIEQGAQGVNINLFKEGRDNNILIALPLYHIFALTVSMISLSKGACGILAVNARNTTQLIKIFQKHPIHGVALIQTLMAAILKHKDVNKIDWQLEQTINGGMKTSKIVAQEWHKLTGCVVDEGYGLSETSPIVALSHHRQEFSEAVGKPVSQTLVKIMNNRKNVKELEHGEIWVKGPQVMQGYWQNPQETYKAITSDGWFKTGDIGYMTALGEIRLVDRIKDIIIVSGFNIYPREVEEVLESHPDVIECGVIGEGDQTSEVVVAYVVTHAKKPNKIALKNYCRTKLAAYKVPKKIVIIDSLPKSNIGKVLRRKLRVA